MALCRLLKLKTIIVFFGATAAEELQKSRVNVRRQYITVYYKIEPLLPHPPGQV